METRDKKVVVTFHSHFEATMMKRRIGGKLIPVPRVLSSSCGSALEVDFEGFDPEKLGTQYEEYYLFDGKEYVIGKAH